MNQNSFVSIIIPCYNQAQYLPETLQSVLVQTYTNWECIIVNDGSPDNTEEVAQEWVRKDRRFKYLKKQNGGLADARNFGIKSSFGDYILPLDSDDIIAPTYIEKAVAVLDRYPEIGIVNCEAIFFGGKTGPWKIPKHSLKRILFFNTIFCTALFRRKDYNATKGYNTNMVYGHEDWDFWISLVERQVKVYRLPERLFFYRIRENSMARSFDLKKLEYLHNQLISNHQELYASHFKNPFMMVEYFKYRQGFSENKVKDFIYLIKNFNPKIIAFYLKLKLYYYLIR